MQKHIHKLYTFIGIPALNSSSLKLLEIPILSIEVQEKIVEILDKFTKYVTELHLRKKQYEYYRDKLLSQEYLNKQSLYKYMEIEEIFDIIAGGDVPKEALSKIKTKEFSIPIISNGVNENSIYGYTNKAKINKPSITISARGTIGWTNIHQNPFFPIVRLLVLTPKIDINLKYAYYFLKSIENDYQVPKTGIPQLTKPIIKNIKIPVPNLETQEKIVNLLDKFETMVNDIKEGLPREIELRQKQYEYYREKLLRFSI